MAPFHCLKSWGWRIGTITCLTLVIWLACTQMNPIDPTSSLQEDANILVNMSATPSRLASGGSQSRILVRLVNKEGEPVEGEVIYFTATLGTITPSDSSNVNGWAEAFFTSGSSSGQANITARWGQSATLNTNIEVIASSQSRFQLSVEPNTLLANGQDKATLTVSVMNDTAAPVKGAEVSFQTTAGVLSSSSQMTNTQGQAIVTLTGPAVETDVVATVTATLDSLVAASTVTFKGVQISLDAVPQVIFSDGRSTSEVRAVLKETTSQIAVSGASVRFATTRGLIPNSAVTDSRGLATVNLTSATTPGSAVISAHYGNTHTVRDTVTFVERTTGESEVASLSASQVLIYANAENVSDLSAVVRNDEGYPVAGATVTFVISPADIPGVPAWAQRVTDNSGTAVLTLLPTEEAGDVTATVSAYVASPASAKTLQISIIRVQLAVSANPTVIPADGTSVSQIQAVLKRVSNNVAVSGQTIHFGTDLGIITAQSMTDGSGVADAELRSGTSSDTAHITVSYGAVQAVPSPLAVFFSETVGEAESIALWAYSTGGSPSSPIDELPADGLTNATIRAVVRDGHGTPLSGETVLYSATIGDITTSAQTNSEGIAEAQFSSGVVGVATITARVAVDDGYITKNITLRLSPGLPATVLLRFNPTSMGVKDSGKNQTVTVFAEVKDSKNNPVEDDTKVEFTVIQSPGGGGGMSPAAGSQIPTVGGIAQCSFSSGTISGVAKIQAEVTEDADGNTVEDVRSIATELLIFAGPAYMEDITDSSTTHLTILPRRLNVYAGLDTTLLTVSASDKYFNEVQEGTAIYVTTSGGKVVMDNPATEPNTDDNGMATFMLQAMDPYPDTLRWYNAFEDPNIPGRLIYGAPPDFDLDGRPNNGIARILAHTNGMDDDGEDIKAWNVCHVVFSHNINHFQVSSNRDSLSPGEAASIAIEIWDINGNPIVGGSILRASMAPQSAPAELSWTEKETGDPGSCYYWVLLYNTVDPTDPEARPTYCSVTIRVNSPNGIVEGSVTVYLDII